MIHLMPSANRFEPQASAQSDVTGDLGDTLSEVKLSPLLATELAALDKRQRAAAVHNGNLAILAGPGAGKTRTLVARVGYLLATTSEHRGVAAITYTDATAREVSYRLSKLGLSPGRRLASRTVHAFCLQYILLPYGALAGHPLPADFQVLDNPDPLWKQALAEAGIQLGRRGAKEELPVLTILRRRIAAGEDTSDFTSRHHVAVREYERRLTESRLLDFEQMTQLALRILHDYKPARELLTARFPHLVIDEYQDLGPVLHALVVELLTAGVTVCAVGDPDQTMYEFQGADPKYLRDLADRRDFRAIPLILNYRSGSALVAAGRAALGADRGYQHDPRRTDPGLIEISPVQGDLEAHAECAVHMAAILIQRGTPAEDIAILYPGQTDLQQLMVGALTEAEISFDSERGRRTPSGPLGDLVSACAARRLSGPLPGSDSQGRSPASATQEGRRRSASTKTPQSVRDLAAVWRHLRTDAGLADNDSVRTLSRYLLPVLDAPQREQPGDDAEDFLYTLSEVLGLRQLANSSRDQRDRTVPETLGRVIEQGLSVAELAGGRAPGRLVLTTYHSSKGREFSAVILPGLVEGLVPFYFANEGISAAKLETARRLFYVALTRAADVAILIPGTQFTAWGRLRQSAWSQFVINVQQVIQRGA